MMPLLSQLAPNEAVNRYFFAEVIRHADVCKHLGINAASLFDTIAKGLFPKPFVIIPGGRAVGWLEHEVDAWIIGRRADLREGNLALAGN